MHILEILSVHDGNIVQGSVRHEVQVDGCFWITDGDLNKER